MDQRLQERLERWHNSIELVAEAETKFRSLEAHEDPLWSNLFLNSDGRNVAEKEARAFVHEDWRSFVTGLVEARVAYNREIALLELKKAAFNASYLEAKSEAEAVNRYPKGGLT